MCRRALLIPALLLSLCALVSAQEAVTAGSHFSLAQQAGQLLVPQVAAGKVLRDSQALAHLETLVREGRIGGIHCLRATAAEVNALTTRLQAIAPVPLLVTADCEGGAGIMFPGATRFPRGMALGKADDTLLTWRVARRTAEESAMLGVNVILAPVADVNVSPQNPIINLRSFGGDSVTVSRHASAFCAGVESFGIVAVAKHFPGHGDTHEDSHLGLPVVLGDLARLRSVELPPFAACAAAGARGVMSAHIALPAVTGAADVPATMSRHVLHDLLRGELKFGGLVFSDALDMGGITSLYASGEAAVRAVEAGCDVLLFPTDIEGMTRALCAAVDSGRLKRAQFQSTAERVLAVRRKLVRGPLMPATELRAALDTDAARALAAECGRRGTEAVRNTGFHCNRSVQLVVLRDAGEDWGFDVLGEPLAQTLRAVGCAVTMHVTDGAEPPPEMEIGCMRVVLACASLSPAGDKRAAERRSVRDALLQQLSSGSVVLLLGNPFVFPELPNAAVILRGFDWDAATQKALGERVLNGGAATR